ncbi:ATP-dependent endonuclease [Pseudomonas sp. LG1D9]|uniref:ATP-dependent nuclease n=1 Tax=Pseudomonas sp. LG1D9 TaxID=2083054 RepID=UPI0015B2835E|nr:AAA family ATPase [Pseudomonas sp. LG1D9]
MYITRIRIKNFRSLVDVEILPVNYTVLAGANDSGKSNVLRALNLFFNNQTDVGKQLVFVDDYSQKAVGRANRAKEIMVELEIQPPKNYTDNDPVVWRKTWREETVMPYDEHMKMIGDKSFSARSKTEYWLRQIGYEYVPAIRGEEFFNTLKRRLHNTLAETIAPKLAKASGQFLKSLRTEVRGIEDEALRILSLKTEFSLPTDLGSLFEILDFKTADKHAATPLQHRGDGVQGRHIPVILRFLADQRKANFAKGRPSPETIFGYEEPENNLELARQVEEADEFYRCSNVIQILLTTHSPAFYSIAKSQDKARALYASRINGATAFVDSTTTAALDDGLGLMPFIEPYLKVALDQRRQLFEQLKEVEGQSLHTDQSVLCVEGDTDKLILEKACSILFGPTIPFKVITKSGSGAGTNWVVGYATARAVMTDVKGRTAVLLDGDEAGAAAEATLSQRTDSLDLKGKLKYFKLNKINGDDELRQALKAGFELSIAIEELCGAAAWDHAESKFWLEPRPDVVKLNSETLKVDQSFNSFLTEKVADEKCRRLIANRIKWMKKNDFSKFVIKQMEETKKVPVSLEKLVREIHKYFHGSL